MHAFCSLVFFEYQGKMDGSNHSENEAPIIKTVHSTDEPATDWKNLGKVGIIYRDAFYTIRRDVVRFPDNQLGGYLSCYPSQTVGGIGGAVIIPICKGRVFLFESYRVPIKRFSMELPRGMIEAETVESTAARELCEELRCQLLSLERIGCIYPDSSILAHCAVVFVAEVDEVSRGTHISDGEVIRETVELSFSEVANLIRSDQIKDGISLAALCLATCKGKISLL